MKSMASFEKGWIGITIFRLPSVLDVLGVGGVTFADILTDNSFGMGV